MLIQSIEFKQGVTQKEPILYDGIPQYAFVGRSNVGKSSTLNALLNNKKIAKVGDTPGKTTEINFFLINQSFYLVDLPGYGYAQGNKTKQEKIKQLIFFYIEDSHVLPKKIIIVLDAKVGLTEYDKEMVDVLRTLKHPYLIVLNKIDKLNQSDLAKQINKIKTESYEENIFPFSAETKKNVDTLWKKIFE
jgi:GTP-binding protein